MLFPLLYITLALQLTAPQAELTDAELQLRRREVRLTHLAIDRTALRDLVVWDARSDALRAARPGEGIDDGTPVLVLHLWATWCGPCKEEFPLWQKLGPSLVEQHKGRVRIEHVALQNDTQGMASFVKELEGRLPVSINHFDRNERLFDKLKLVDKQLVLPVTLLLDGERIVRQVFIGPIHDRRQELTDSIGRLVRLSKVQEVLSRAAPTRPAAPGTRPAAAPPVKIYGID